MVLITLALRRPKQGGLTLEKLTAPGEKKMSQDSSHPHGAFPIFRCGILSVSCVRGGQEKTEWQGGNSRNALLLYRLPID